MASVVYDGVIGGGDLFAGIKFCFLQRIPMRQRWIDLVKSNGGEIVQLEKRADYVVADPIIRSACPPGSISWKFIENSVKQGVLEDIKDYRAGPSTHVVRDAGSDQSRRMGRTPYTAEDDRILMDWVSRTERAGGSTGGNEIYKPLEARYPRHPWQSWRDRWVKTVSSLPRPTVLEDHDNKEAQTQRLSQTTAMPSMEKKSGTRLKSNPKTMRSPSPPIPWIAKSKRGMNFTTREIQLLTKNYHDIQNLDPDKLFDAWAAWSVSYPDHTPQEWRNYFVKELTPLMEKRNTNASKEAAKGTDRDVNSTGKSKSRLSGATGVRPTRSSSDVENSDPPPGLKTEVDHLTEEEARFKEDLTDLAEEMELQVDFEPKICGRTLPLFRLWQIVMSDEFGGKDKVDRLKLWPKVARKLNFSDFQHSSATKELRACYEEILVDFEEVKRQYTENLTPTGSDEQALIEDQLFRTAVHNNQPVDTGEEDEFEHEDDLHTVSPPVMPHSFRKRRRVDLSDKTPFSKSQRVDKGKGKELEIPSTPEDVIKSNQAKTSIYQSLPLKSSPILGDKVEQGRRENFLKGRLKQKDQLSMSSNRATEPDTQDFNFLPDDAREEDKIDVANESGSSSLPSPSLKANRPNRSRDPTPKHALHEDSSTQSQTESEINAQLIAYVDDCIALGYTPEVVGDALNACSLEAGDAKYVMEELRSGRGIPEDRQGVWTSKDDLALEDEGDPEFLRILAKHGHEFVTKRRRFLEDEEKVRDTRQQ